MKKNNVNPELIKEFKNLIKNAKKICVSGFSSDYRYQLIKFENFWSFYCYTAGSRFNISGRHYHYLHNLKTGDFYESCNYVNNVKIIDQARLLKADVLSLLKIMADKIHASEKLQGRV